MKPKKLILTGMILAAGLFGLQAKAQSDSSSAESAKPRGSSTKFLLAGKATASWTNTMAHVDGSPDVKAHTFFPDGLMLMPLVKLNDRLFLDAQIELAANDGIGAGATMNLNEIIMYYRLAPNLNIMFGNFSPKHGLYLGVLDDFTNRYATDPIGVSRGPQTQTGIGIQGGLQLGYSKMNYQVYLSNGPRYIVDSTGATHGQMGYDNYTDNNKNKAIGGSIGFLPFSNSSLQIDVSGQYAGKTGNDGTPFESLSSYSWAADLNYYHSFNPITVRVLTEYNFTKTANNNLFTNSADTAKLIPSFNNQFSGWFCGATIRPSGLKNKFVKRLELGGRVGAYTPPTFDTPQTVPGPNGTNLMVSPWGENPKTQTTVCLTYWMTWKTPLNIAYDVIKEKDGATVTTYTARFIYFF